MYEVPVKSFIVDHKGIIRKYYESVSESGGDDECSFGPFAPQ